MKKTIQYLILGILLNGLFIQPSVALYCLPSLQMSSYIMGGLKQAPIFVSDVKGHIMIMYVGVEKDFTLIALHNGTSCIIIQGEHLQPIKWRKI